MENYQRNASLVHSASKSDESAQPTSDREMFLEDMFCVQCSSYGSQNLVRWDVGMPEHRCVSGNFETEYSIQKIRISKSV